ncbi:hypothetical protein FA95DRAFT_1314656 [Auriscalpium vulgare]|uniref:Uncharacterized protein n=1 Tax=Auriscalpium vulgare TaxID=40419 RepID=A0ACB8S970_9AGAM|nr:hypothetical protein FA95DRAFT_1314656 [Auriscalpium vulgare]
MVQWQDPATVLRQLESLVKLVHVMDGIYLWEFLSSLDYEWSILRGRRNWRWTVWLYIGCRVFTLGEVVADLTGFNATTPINCETWLIFVLTFAYTSSTFALSLYGLRTIALWKRNRFVMAFIAVAFIVNVAFWIRSVVEASASWNAGLHSCAIAQTHKGLQSNITTLVTDVLLLAVISVGVLHKTPGKAHLGALLYREGLLWLALATAIQILPVVRGAHPLSSLAADLTATTGGAQTFLALNYNDSMNLMFQTPSLICSTIGATRIYRLLSSIGTGNVLEYWESTRNETTGEIRFRRQTHLLAPADQVTSTSTAVPLGRMFVERFEARDIKLEDDAASTVDVKRGQ